MNLARASRILIISPQRWQGFKVSKHHYAIELVERGHMVYFLEPPERKYTSKIRVIKISQTKEIYLIKYGLVTPYFFRFHIRKIYDLAMLWQARRIRDLIEKIDVIWDFDNVAFFTTLPFNAALRIYHPVDVFVDRCNGKQADVMFSVSPTLLDLSKNHTVPKFFINHGLSKTYESYARERLEFLRMGIRPRSNEATANSKTLTVGYVGNLDHPAIDWDFMTKALQSHQDIKFIFFGPYTRDVGRESRGIDTLHRARNVELRGLVGPEEILKGVEEIDLFLMCYKKTEGYFMDNSHKILEYLATGKTIVSSILSVYQSSELIRMPAEDGSITLLEILTDTIDRIDCFNAFDRQICRIEYALDHTYARQVDRIKVRLGSLN